MGCGFGHTPQDGLQTPIRFCQDRAGLYTPVKDAFKEDLVGGHTLIFLIMIWTDLWICYKLASKQLDRPAAQIDRLFKGSISPEEVTTYWKAKCNLIVVEYM